jgi:hypothetical protein
MTAKRKKSRAPRPTKKPRKPRKPGTGGVPAGVLASWNAKGYLTPVQAAARAGTARSTIYGWLERKALGDDLDGQPCVVRGGAFFWLLAAAVDRLRPPVPASGTMS